MAEAMPPYQPQQNGKLTNGSHNDEEDADTEQLSQLDKLREQVSQSISEMRTLLHAMRTRGDDSQLPHVQNNTASHDLAVILRDVGTLGPEKLEDLATVMKKAKLDQLVDDKTYLMERLIKAAACLPNDLVSKSITNTFVTTLWDDLQHPPQTLLQDEFTYRQPDGSKNNYTVPHIGAAGMPYARTVTPKVMRPGAMPDPGVLFDTLMARKDPEGTEHPAKISSMLFYLASIIIHDVFKTNRNDYNISDTSSYLDLAPLYGSTWTEQKRMRTMKDGKVKPDCFSETRLLTFPPGVGAILIMFNRYHNYVVEQLALINEDGRFTENPKKPNVDRYGESINKRDDDLFQTARLVTCGLYVNIILIDYVRTILDLNRTDQNWQLDPRVEIPDGPPRGTGNQVSCEFNLVYRWHAAISNKDDKWTQDLFHELFPEDTAAEISTPQGLPKFLQKLGALEKISIATEPEQRPFPALASGRYERIPDGPLKGRFKDEDLAKTLAEGVEDCANAMGPQQVPTVMKAIEMLGIIQARSWRVATLNEFRTHFALQPHRTFKDITENEEVAHALKYLYGTPDNVELYPGLVVEDAKVPVRPGSGLCPGYTVSRGVLSDAVALVRGDRYYTTSYTPASLTNWGYREASSDLNIDNGCVFYKLFLHALPNSFDPASVYIHYPMTVPYGPNGMHEALEQLGKGHKYNFDQPKPTKQPVVLFSYKAAKQVLDDPATFRACAGRSLEWLMGTSAKNFMLVGDGPKNAQSRKLMEHALYLGSPSRSLPTGQEKWLRAVRDFYEDATTHALREKSYSLGGVHEVEIIRDVGNIAHVHFASEMFSLPLKTHHFPHGVFTESQLYLIMAAIYNCVFFEVDVPSSFQLRQQAYDAVQQLGAFMQLQVAAVAETGSFAESLIEAVKPTAKPLKDYGIHMISHLVKEGTNVADLVWGNIMGTVSGIVAAQSQLFGLVMDYYLNEGQEHLSAINRAAKQNTPEADEFLMRYAMEGVRLRSETGVLRTVNEDVTVPDKTKPLGDKVHHLKRGDKIKVNLQAASQDPTVFPNPDKVDLRRRIDSYLQFGHGLHQCLGMPMAMVALTTMLKVVGRLDNLRSAPITIGKTMGTSEVKKVVQETQIGDAKALPDNWNYHAFLTEDWDMFFPFPTSK